MDQGRDTSGRLDSAVDRLVMNLHGGIASGNSDGKAVRYVSGNSDGKAVRYVITMCLRATLPPYRLGGGRVRCVPP
jgi:hypothetical protein